MTARLIDIPYRELHPFVRALSDAGADEELAKLVRQPGNAEKAVAAMRQALAEPTVVGTRKRDEVALADRCAPDFSKLNVVNPAEIMREWSQFYHDYLGMDANFASLVVPAHQPGFDRLITMPAGLTPNKVVAACRKHFRVFTYTEDLDAAVTENERDPKTGAYIIRVRDRVEADEELKNLSVNDIRERQLTTMTLLERLVYEFKYFSETGKHLDIRNITLCSGSRRSGGDVPRVYWCDDKLCVVWYGPDDARGLLRARACLP